MIAISDNNFGRRLKYLLVAFHLISTWDSTSALTVDNQLVSARNDCFERIALEAMLPFEKTFRTEDTNSLKMCKEKCLQAGEKCQAISFGVHRRGNGTCQLSSEQYGSGGGGRPGGVIFDPDFDLYTRKTNCFDLSDNSIGPGPLPIPGPSPISPGPTPVDLPNRPLDVGNTPVLVVNPTPHTDGPPPPPSLGPPTPSLGPPGVGDRLYFSHDLYPLYKYPTLYEHNYPAPNEEVYIPGGYAANVPEVDERYRPHYGPSEDEGPRPTPHGPPRPIFGLGYGNGYSYGSPERYTPPTIRPPSGSSEESYARPPRPTADRPDYPPGPPRPTADRPDYPPGPPPRPYESSTPSSYGPRPSPTYDPHREPRPDYTNRPDPPPQAPHDGYGMNGPSARPPPPYGGSPPPPRDDYVRRNGSVMRPGDGYGAYDDDKSIATYFNPDDFMQGGNKRPMPGDRDRDRLGYPMDELKGDVAWRHYTVSGKPCRRSSPCEKNLVTGFYSCETDGAEVGSWDYCCKADHPCGYSRGFDYPWCFVGDEPDQWRKCSDRYFPGKNSTQPGPGHSHTHSHLAQPSGKEKQKHPQPATAASNEYSQHPPRPGGLQSLSDFAAARLWPVTYLYSEGPPNATEFSNFVDCNKESC
ncbi:uncharacterized protein Dana_GF12577, isoform B [Drosophila ananassae]|uniref:Uncharacterized protein, isoform B n=1 Tax=Drosophila ananassae TaxID=7217 RepID=A0A0P8Y1T9_DROAN|nr:uncharacterized protein Dana_GF12577, isoform B [Drosophila ananassae]